MEDESRMLMCVFKGENGEVVITLSTGTVIRRFLLPGASEEKLLLLGQLV